MMGSYSELVRACHGFLNLTVDGHIDKALALNIPVAELLDRAWNFSFTKEEDALYKRIENHKNSEIVRPAELAVM